MTVRGSLTALEDKLTESFILGMDREGDLEASTEGATKITSASWIELAVDGAIPSFKTGSRPDWTDAGPRSVAQRDDLLIGVVHR